MATMVFRLSVLLLTFSVARRCGSTSAIYNFTRLYNEAKIHYLDEEWEETVDSFEDLLTRWKEVHRTMEDCRLGCESESKIASSEINIASSEINIASSETKIASSQTKKASDVNAVYSSEIERAFETASCQLQCRPYYICDKTIEKLLRRNMPHNYLQLAYYKLNDLEQAASCAFTYFIKNMDDEVAVQNLQHWRNMPGMRASYFKDRDLREHQELFIAAPELYSNGAKKEQFLKKLNDGFSNFFTDFESCLSKCQDAISIHDEFEENDGDLASNLGIHLTQYFNCTIFCEDVSTSINGESSPDYVLIYLLYLHSLASEVGDHVIDQKVLASIATFNLNEAELNSLELSPELVYDNNFIPFSDFSQFISRRKQTGILTDLLTDSLNDLL